MSKSLWLQFNILRLHIINTVSVFQIILKVNISSGKLAITFLLMSCMVMGTLLFYSILRWWNFEGNSRMMLWWCNHNTVTISSSDACMYIQSMGWASRRAFTHNLKNSLRFGKIQIRQKKYKLLKYQISWICECRIDVQHSKKYAQNLTWIYKKMVLEGLATLLLKRHVAIFINLKNCLVKRKERRKYPISLI